VFHECENVVEWKKKPDVMVFLAIFANGPNMALPKQHRDNRSPGNDKRLRPHDVRVNTAEQRQHSQNRQYASGNSRFRIRCLIKRAPPSIRHDTDGSAYALQCF
jgi:hypothetical protein